MVQIPLPRKTRGCLRLSYCVDITEPQIDDLPRSDELRHRLRKLYSTYLGDLSVSPRIMQAQLGHADAAMTLNVYTQIVPESQRRAIENLEGLLFRNVPKEKEETVVQ
jgi:integrase